MLARAALLAVAVVAAAWLAYAYPGARDEARAKAILATPPQKLAPAERERVLALLRDARRGRPDDTALVREASVLTFTGQRAQAAGILRGVLRREPENVTAWTLLAFADPARAAEANERRRALAPPVR